MMPEFGATTWGRAWVRAIEPTGVSAPNPLLPKARTLARNKAVTLTPEPGRVIGNVATAGAVHHVRIDLPLWTVRDSAEAERLQAKALANHLGLAPGDLPDELEEDLRQHKIAIAVCLDEQQADCDCRSQRRPCIHILATLYTLAQLIDERPALAIDLRSPTAERAEPPDPDWIPLTELDAQRFYGD
ncbi:SWIM zinc finger family protein [Saccharopolyspora spinosa]|uniref:SWIM zinc finger protein n=1 Tax=Saccharopolyspora spinosa TaxID=60894 RepID=A0A2N3Y2X4_SACSN|nr:SWIM zinc finger family protein [Saccharopolyspora spinosa]PKW17262.1 SWIM zinc finger protein [Saccharopolyspora spinosa]